MNGKVKPRTTDEPDAGADTYSALPVRLTATLPITLPAFEPVRTVTVTVALVGVADE